MIHKLSKQNYSGFILLTFSLISTFCSIWDNEDITAQAQLEEMENQNLTPRHEKKNDNNENRGYHTSTLDG